jgi:hypothetical protein
LLIAENKENHFDQFRMKLPYDTVRQIWQHWQTHQQLEPNYDACSHPGIHKPQAVWERALALKREHPRWDAVLIRLHLEDEFDAHICRVSVPCKRGFVRQG